MATDLADGAALLGGGGGDALGHAGDGADRRDYLVQRPVGGLGLAGGGLGVRDLGAHGTHRQARGLLQAADQFLDLGGGAAGALRQRTHLVGDHGKTTAGFAGARRLDGGIERQQVGLLGDAADYRQHVTDGGGFRGQALDRLGVALDFADQRVQTIQALADDLLTLAQGAVGIAAGGGGLAGVAGDLLNGGLQLAEGVADLPGVAGLALGAGVQAAAEVGQGAAGAGDLLGMLADGADQLDQVGAQAVQRGLDVAQFAGAGVQLDVLGEVALGPGRQRRHQSFEQSGQAALDAVDGQGDEQDQADHQALDQAHLALDPAVFGAHQRLEGAKRLLHGIQSLPGGRDQLAALLDQRLGAFELRRVAADKAGEVAPEGDALVLGLAGVTVAVQAEQGREAVAGRGAVIDHAEQGQGVQRFGLARQCAQLTLDVGEQFAAAATDQLVSGLGQASEVLGGVEQRPAVGAGVCTVGVVRQLLQRPGHFPFGLDQQALGVAGQLAGGEQFAGAEVAQLGEARAQVVGQLWRQRGDCRAQVVDGLQGAAVAQGIATVEVVEDVARDLLLELLREAQVALHQLVRALQGALRPPERGAEGDAHGDQQQGVEVGEGFEAHRTRPAK